MERCRGSYHVVHVVGGVKIDSVPAPAMISMVMAREGESRDRLRRESKVDHDTRWTWLFGKRFCLREASAHVLEAGIRELRIIVRLFLG